MKANCCPDFHPAVSWPSWQVRPRQSRDERCQQILRGVLACIKAPAVLGSKTDFRLALPNLQNADALLIGPVPVRSKGIDARDDAVVAIQGDIDECEWFAKSSGREGAGRVSPQSIESS